MHAAVFHSRPHNVLLHGSQVTGRRRRVCQALTPTASSPSTDLRGLGAAAATVPLRRRRRFRQPSRKNSGLRRMPVPVRRKAGSGQGDAIGRPAWSPSCVHSTRQRRSELHARSADEGAIALTVHPPEGRTCSRYQASTRNSAHSIAMMPSATLMPAHHTAAAVVRNECSARAQELRYSPAACGRSRWDRRAHRCGRR
jgi:hypothetical protein